MLYLVSTPIGNLDDFSFRAVQVLKDCSLILCEDTRHSRTLMQRYDISTPLKSYHKFNEASRENEVLQLLESGQEIALLSDAGTPGICDPGEALVQLCRERGVEVQSIPGAAAFLQALVCSGLKTSPFQFLGFLPKKDGERKRALWTALHYEGSSVFYESPHRIVETLDFLHELAPECRCAIAREISTKFEQHLLGTPLQVKSELKEVRGEFVLLLEGCPSSLWDDLPPLEHIKSLEKALGIGKKEAIRLVADLRGLNRRELYKESNS